MNRLSYSVSELIDRGAMDQPQELRRLFHRLNNQLGIILAHAELMKKKAADEENAKLRADSCTRAKQAKATIDSGVRLTVTNDKGEREIMDDNARAAETKRLDGVIARSCS